MARSSPAVATHLAPPKPASAALVAILETCCVTIDWWLSGKWPVSHLYYLPIALAGAVFGFVAAIPVAVFSAGMFIVINFGYHGRVAGEADIMRLILFLAVGLVTSILRRDARNLAIAARSLAEANSALAKTNEELRREQSMRVQYVARAAHDVTQPLTAIRMGADLLLRRREPNPSLSERQLKTISANGRRIANMLENLVEAARMETEGFQLHLARGVDLERIVREAADTFTCTDGREINVDVREAIPKIRGDDRHLLRVFMNLIGNAVKYSPPGSPIHVAITPLDSLAKVTVRDEGVGIPANDIEKVLQPFVRSSASDGTSGFGLGLAVSREIIFRHGGRLEMESCAGRGTSVHVLLPVSGSRD